MISKKSCQLLHVIFFSWFSYFLALLVGLIIADIFGADLLANKKGVLDYGYNYLISAVFYTLFGSTPGAILFICVKVAFPKKTKKSINNALIFLISILLVSFAMLNRTLLDFIVYLLPLSVLFIMIYKLLFWIAPLETNQTDDLLLDSDAIVKGKQNQK